MVVRLEGEAGIGKTTIAAGLATEAEEAGADVWSAAATEIAASHPFGAVLDLRASDGHRLLGADRLSIGTQRSVAGTPPSVVAGRFGAVESIIESVEAACQTPTMFVIDDAHWADPASLEALAGLARVALTHPLVVAITNRPGSHGPAFERLTSELEAFGCHTIDIEPLASTEVDDLLGELCGAAPDVTLRQRVAGANGNPFLLRQYVDGLLAEGRLRVTNDEAHAAQAGIPAQLRAAIAAELARLGEEVSSVLRAAAVQGDLIDAGDVASLLDRGPVTLAGPIQKAVEAGLLAEDGRTLRFRHDLVRIAVYEQMPVALRIAIHRQLADLLARRGAPPAVIGSHLVLSGGTADHDAIELLQRAAADVAPVDPESALEFLDRARELATGDTETRRVIERARMEALTGAGRLGEAVSVVHWLLGASPPDLHAELWARQAGLSLLEGDAAAALESLERAESVAVDDAERAPIAALASMTSAVARDYERARHFAERANELGQRADEPIGQSVGLAMTARMSTYNNVLEPGLRMGATAVAIADADQTGAAHDYVPCLHYGMTALDADRLDTAQEMVARGNELADRFGMSWSTPLFGALAAAIHHRRGELDSALAEADSAIELAEATSSRQTLSWSLAIRSLVLLEMGDIEAAMAAANEAALAFASGQSSLGVNYVVLARARATEMSGDADDAYEQLLGAWRQFDDERLTFCQPLIAPDLGLMARKRGDDEVGAMVTAATVTAGTDNGVAATQAVGELLGAVLANDSARAREGLGRLERSERRLEVAEWLIAAPELLRPSAVEALTEARDIYERTGAVGAVARIDSRLPADVGHEPAAVSGWASLTPTELAIVQLLASGLTNAQIATERGSSRRTVESHLGRVYQKMEIAGRVALTVAAAERFRV